MVYIVIYYTSVERCPLWNRTVVAGALMSLQSRKITIAIILALGLLRQTVLLHLRGLEPAAHLDPILRLINVRLFHYIYLSAIYVIYYDTSDYIFIYVILQN
jgi:hypothetical protein